MNLRAHRRTRNDTLRDICCLIIPPIYSSISKGCENEEVRYAMIFLCLEGVSFTLDLFGGSHQYCLLASLLLSAIIIVPFTIHVYFIKKSRIRALNKPEAEQLFMLEIVFAVIQLILSGVSYFATRSSVTNPSVFPLAFTITAVVYAFKNSKAVPHSSSHTSDTPPPPPPDQLEDTEHTDPAQLTDVHVDRPDTPSKISKPEVVPSETRNQNFEPSSSYASEVQRTPSTGTLRKRKNASSKSDRGQKNEVIPSVGSVPSSHANESQPEPSTSSKDNITFEQSDDHQCNNDQAKSSSNLHIVVLVVILSSFMLLHVAIIPYIFNIRLPMLSFSRLPSLRMSVDRLLNPLYSYVAFNIIIIMYIAASSFHRTWMELFGSQDESDSRYIPRNSTENSLSSDIWAQIAYKDGVEEEKEENLLFSIGKRIFFQTYLKEDFAAENPTRATTMEEEEEEMWRLTRN